MWNVVFFVGLASLTAAKLQNMGPCDRVVATDGFFNLTKFSEEEKGTWTFIKVPAAKSNEDLKSMYLTTKATKRPGQYHTIIYYKNKNDQEYKVFSDEDIYDSLSGHVLAVARGKNKIEFKISFLKYVPGRLAYYFICSEQRGDRKVDYRYVVAHGPLNTDEELDIRSLEDQYRFLGALKHI
uniref:Lipocalin/cytosolic fatty-acid binding domain-containing protein n=1 Tax=Cuerna arida TaxID=1464854 RepID=A0A1B6G5M3_9HEMI